MKMAGLHSWEEVYSTGRAIDGIVPLVNRFTVPGGWIYVHTIMRSRIFGRDDVFTSTVFVPTPVERSR
jgi:hypothetical protein